MGVGWSMHRNGAWIGQLQRTRRWHERLARAARGDGYAEDDLADFGYAFFQNCFHLREWVQHTANIPRADLDAFMGREEMQVCRDLANGTKHLNITRPNVDARFSIGREYDPRSHFGYRLFVITDNEKTGGEKYDLFDLASRCLEAWEQFLAPHQHDVRDAVPPFLEPSNGPGQNDATVADKEDPHGK